MHDVEERKNKNKFASQRESVSKKAIVRNAVSKNDFCSADFFAIKLFLVCDLNIYNNCTLGSPFRQTNFRILYHSRLSFLLNSTRALA